VTACRRCGLQKHRAPAAGDTFAQSMPLLPVVLSADLDSDDTPGSALPANTLSCAYCGTVSGGWQKSVRSPVDAQRRVAACPLCFLCCHLERPSIDAEAALLWLPEMSQAALNVTMRMIHTELRALGEDLDDAPLRNTPKGAKIDRARSALGVRRAAASARLGTDRPSELAAALYRLSPGAYVNRSTLLSGVRLLPRGHFYERGADVYPEIVDYWRGLAAPPASSPPGRPAPLSEG
jgi:intracellular multiplication protein IcmJ